MAWELRERGASLSRLGARKAPLRNLCLVLLCELSYEEGMEVGPPGCYSYRRRDFDTDFSRHCAASESPSRLVKTQILASSPEFLIQEVWAKSQAVAFLTRSLVTLMLLVRGQCFERTTGLCDGPSTSLPKMESLF